MSANSHRALTRKKKIKKKVDLKLSACHSSYRQRKSEKSYIISVIPKQAVILNLHVALPVLGDLKRPFKLEMDLAIIVNESRECIIVPTSDDTRGGLFLVD